MIWKHLNQIINILTDELFGRLCESEQFLSSIEAVSDKELAKLKANWHVIISTRLVPFIEDIYQMVEKTILSKPRFYYLDYYPFWKDPFRVMRVICPIFSVKYVRIKGARTFSHAIVLAYVRKLL